MDAVKKLVSTNSLKTTLLSAMVKRKKSPLFFHYDDEMDVFMLLLADPNTETVVHYVDEHVAILYIPDSHEIVGLQIEDFVNQFMPKYNSLQRAWKLSDAGIRRDNLWDLTLAVEKQKITVALEVLKATEPLIGQPAQWIERALEYA
ncbi:MAG: hypothetical protein HND47_03925 [Chloroflexi bacterium]|nr:hypothetical protein [Chloroflexota bacterium]